MLRNDRIYKSLALKDFMEHASFVLAKGGCYLPALIANFNYERTLEKMKDESKLELEEIFVSKVQRAIGTLGLNIKIIDMGSYYDIWTELSQ